MSTHLTNKPVVIAIVHQIDVVVYCLVFYLWDPSLNPTGGTMWIRFSVPAFVRVFLRNNSLGFSPPHLKLKLPFLSSPLWVFLPVV